MTRWGWHGNPLFTPMKREQITFVLNSLNRLGLQEEARQLKDARFMYRIGLLNAELMRSVLERAFEAIKRTVL